VTDDARTRLEAREAELVRALNGGPPAEGIDERMTALAAEGIARKRQRLERRKPQRLIDRLKALIRA
jgi:hypothetical protein